MVETLPLELYICIAPEEIKTELFTVLPPVPKCHEETPLPPVFVHPNQVVEPSLVSNQVFALLPFAVTLM